MYHSARMQKIRRRRMAEKGLKIFKLVVLAFLVATIFNLVGAFFETHSVRFQSPIVIEKKETMILSPIPTDTPTPTPTATPGATLKIIKEAYAKEPTPTPSPKSDNSISGEASYYSRAGCLGCDPNFIMANGEALDDGKLTLALTPEVVAAGKRLNDTVTVVNVKTGDMVKAKVTDTGGFGRLGRVADLSVATKNAINCSSLCQVKVIFE